jgi:hypothetical protein
MSRRLGQSSQSIHQTNTGEPIALRKRGKSVDSLCKLDTAISSLATSAMRPSMDQPKPTPKDKLKRFGLFSWPGEQRFFARLGEAVSRYLDSQSVVWVDRGDRAVKTATGVVQEDRSACSIDLLEQTR